MQVLELKGLKSLRAFNMFNALMLGLKMLPMYASESYESFYEKIKAMSPADQEKMIREAAAFVELDKDEVESALSFVTDANGLPIGPNNIKNMGPAEIFEAIVAVAKKVAEIKIDLVSEAEKKNSQDSQLT